jgi:hypothetical protein
VSRSCLWFMVLVGLVSQSAAYGQGRVVQAIQNGESLEVMRAKIHNNGWDFTVGRNRFYDMTREQKAAFLSRHAPLVPMYGAKSDDMGPLADHLGRLALPSQFCWTNYNGHSYIGAVRDQGGCGSCYSFGANACAESTINAAAGRYDANCVDLSESFIIWCVARLSPYIDHFYGCDGADYDYFELEGLVQIGACKESAFPYQESDPGSCSHMGDPKVKMSAWYRIPCGDIDAIKTAIMTYGAVDAAVYVGDSFMYYDGGIYNDTYTDCNDTPCYYKITNHAIALVGWNDNGGNGYWILRNSWGSWWGESGYMRIRYTAAAAACEVAYMVYDPTPVATTKAATSVGMTSLTLNGEVDARGRPTTYYFEFGTNTSYGTTTEPLSGGSDIFSVPVSSVVSGLMENVTYHYRLVASNSAAVTYGADMPVTTRGFVVLMEDFEGGALPAGWSQQYVNGTAAWAFYAGSPAPWEPAPTMPHGGAYNACLYYEDNLADHKTRLITPQLDFSGFTNGATLSFWHCMAYWVPDQDQLRVYCRTSAVAGWNLVAAFTNDVPDWTNRVLSLPNVNRTYSIAFEGNAKYGYGVCLDDVLVQGNSHAAPALCALTVTTPYGTASPAAGVYSVSAGSTQSCAILDSPVAGGVGTQYVCAGWTGTGSLLSNLSGGPDTGAFAITNDTTIAWQWKTNFYLTLDTNGQGTVSAASGWRAGDSSVAVTGTAATYWHFDAWCGDTNGCTPTSNRIAVVMNRARTLQARFVANTGALGTPEAWLASFGLTNDLPSVLELQDLDGDGMAAWQEYYAGTCPTNPASALRMVDLRVAGGSNLVRWLSAYGPQPTQLPYTVWSSTNLTGGLWRWETNIPVRTPPTNQLWMTVPGGDLPVYYRVTVTN